MHLAEEQVERFLHGELTPPAATWVRDHLAGCAECRGRVSEAENDERWVLDTLRVLDHVQAPLQSTLVVHAAKSRGSPAWGRWAAGILLGIILAGGAYAAPGSPLPRALDRIVRMVLPRGEAGLPVAPPAASDAQAGIAVSPGDRLTISINAGPIGDTAAVTLTDGAELVVQARGGNTTFTSDPDRLTITRRGTPVWLEIQIPRRAPRVEIVVEDRRLFLKQNSRLTAPVTADRRGRYLIPLSASAQ